jgi:Fic family protein
MEEVPTRIEPAFFEDSIPAVLSDLVVELQGAAKTLGEGLHHQSAAELAEFVRVMNCYYSNLIEGHKTRPKDIEQALAAAEGEDDKRPLVAEAKAHVLVQRQIDKFVGNAKFPSPTSTDFISTTHRQFYELMPAEFRFVTRPDGTKDEIVPGAFRSSAKDDVVVGRHIPPSSGYVRAFMDYFSNRYAQAEKSPTNRIIAIAAAHHRFNFIHPFPDGNGRVSRLMSHAMSVKAGVNDKGLWSISRGLARGLKDKGEYMQLMDHADHQRMGSLDGRGNLSTRALQDYCEWFLSVALDQVQFAKSLFTLDTLDERYRRLVVDQLGDKRAAEVVSAVLRHGSMDRGDIQLVTKTSERTARNTLKELVEAGFLKSTSPKSPVHVAFPVAHRERLFPSLFTDGDLEVPAPRVTNFSRGARSQETLPAQAELLADPEEEKCKRISDLASLAKSMRSEKVLYEVASAALSGTDQADIDWKTVEDQVIEKSIGEFGFSRTEVIGTLWGHSPGAATESEKDDIYRRVQEAAPKLVAMYNQNIKPPGRR